MNKSLKILYFYNGLFCLADQALGPLYAVFVGGLDSNVLAISISWSVFLVSNMAFTLLVSKLGDRVKEREYLLVSGYLVRALVWFLYVFVNNIWQLVALQFILGIGPALSAPAFGAMVAEHLDHGKHVADYGNWHAIICLVGAVGVAMGGFIVEYFGFDALFSCMSLTALACVIGILLNPRKAL